MANFKPDQNEYKNLTPFKMWLVNQINTWGCSNFPFLESDFDKLTNYAMMMKLMKAMNNVIANENKVEEDMTNLFNAFTELQNYVNNYFDNLDVQEEINNKLDEMAESGELTTLIRNYVDPIYQAYETEINSQIEEQNIKINAIESGSPLVASSTSGMTDTSRVYVNTTDGYWYYYNGTAWTQGGIYQSTALAEGEVTYSNLDNKLKNEVNKDLNKKIIYTLDGKYINDSKILSSNANTRCIKLDASKSWVLRIESSGVTRNIGSGYGDGEGSWLSYIIANNKTASSPNITPILLNRYDSSHDYFLIPALTGANLVDYPYFFANIKLTISNWDFDFDIYEYNDIIKESNMKILGNVNQDATNYESKNQALQNFQIKGYITDDTLGNILSSNSSTYRAVLIPLNTTKHIYMVNNIGHIYTVDSLLRNSVEIATADSQFEIIDNRRLRHYVIEPSETAKFVIVNEKLSFVESLPHIYDNAVNTFGVSYINNELIKPINSIRNWYTFGDSITNKNYRALVNYIDYTVNDLNIKNYNYAISGQGYMEGLHNFTEQLSNLTDYNQDTDIITVMGSINDVANHSSELGHLGDTTMDTIYGSMYTFFNTLFTAYPGCRIGIITPIPSKNYHTNPTNMDNYIVALKDTAKLFNVPILDILNSSNLRPWDNTFLNEFYEADGVNNTGQIDSNGVHPNSKGHQLFYSRIKEFIRTL